jgi:hypothetical protein
MTTENPYPTYPTEPLPSQTNADRLYAEYLPVTRNSKAGGAAQFDEALRRMDHRAFEINRTAVPVFNAIDKLGVQMSTFDYVIIGEGRHAEELQKIFDQVRHWPEFCRAMAWAVAEGARYGQFRPAPDREDHYTTLTFADGVRRKFLASDPHNGEGSIHNDGNNIYQVRQSTGLAIQLATRLDPKWWVKFVWGLNGNPEGDSLIGRVLYPLADAWHKFLSYILDHGELYGVPMRVLRSSKPWQARRTEMVDAMRQTVDVLVEAKGGDTVHIGEQEIALIESAKGFEDLTAFLEAIGEWIYRVVLHNTLTSTVSNAERTGDTTVHLSEEQRAAYSVATALAEIAGPQLLNTIIELNEPLLPRKLKSEPAPYLWPIPAGNRKKGELYTEEDLLDPTADSNEQPQPTIENRLETSSNGNGRN